MRRATTLVLVRHAHVNASKDGAPLMCGTYDPLLSEYGRFQLQPLHARLQQEPAAALYSSRLKRALQTAGVLSPELRSLRSLQEIHCGKCEGVSISEVQTRYPEHWARNLAQNDEWFRWPGGEPYIRFRRRVMRVLRAIVKRHCGERVIVVTHAGVINQLLGAISGQSAARWENYRPENASLTEVSWSSAGPELVTFNDCTHLAAEKFKSASGRPPCGEPEASRSLPVPPFFARLANGRNPA